jgi:hypothetical protein
MCRAEVRQQTGRSVGRSRYHDHPDFTEELPRKLLPTRAKEAQSHFREKR